jgi:DNA polymerase III epsilon subunit-like protein
MTTKNYFVFWDVESTSKIPTEDHIISLGSVVAEYANSTFVKVDSFHTYVHTKKPIDPAAFRIHGITSAQLASAPPLALGIRQWVDWIRGCTEGGRVILMAHNGRGFDDVILYCNCFRQKICFNTFLSDIRCCGFLDTLRLLRTLTRGGTSAQVPCNPATGRASYTLGHCYTSYCGGTVLDNAHDALADSVALFDIFSSPVISARINLSVLFQSVETREKAVKRISQSAGMAFTDDGVSGAAEHCTVQHTTAFRTGAGFVLCTSCMVFGESSSHVHSLV